MALGREAVRAGQLAAHPHALPVLVAHVAQRLGSVVVAIVASSERVRADELVLQLLFDIKYIDSFVGSCDEKLWAKYTLPRRPRTMLPRSHPITATRHMSATSKDGLQSMAGAGIWLGLRRVHPSI